ncbi:GH39 family glycosyl hydrolase [Propioniciclava soli]|uniref:GH39 family glycosyl hydrolase n=1 Tax=Propioniciclava soli TaxID=2775081 RepID=UPI003CC82DC3
MTRIDVPPTGSRDGADAWRACVGTGRLSLALRHDHLASLDLVQREIGFRHVRGHGLLCDDMAVVQPWSHAGESATAYNFTHVDLVFDAWLERGIRPFVELGFMPEALASGDQTVFWWRGNVTPPRDLSAWCDLVRALLEHLIARYGLEEVLTWPIEVWNEPNLTHFWRDADQAAYLALYEASARTVKDVHPGLQVGGPRHLRRWGGVAGRVPRALRGPRHPRRLPLPARLHLGARRGDPVLGAPRPGTRVPSVA